MTIAAIRIQPDPAIGANLQTPKHVPVMPDETRSYLLHEGTRVVLDGTVGCGGHSALLLQAAPHVRLIGVDRDPAALEEARCTLSSFADRVTLREGVFSDLKAVLASVGAVDGVLLDLGVSSMQIDEAARGFSYAQDGPLDMRMGRSGDTAAERLAQLDESEIGRVLSDFGDVHRPRDIARSIAEAARRGELRTTGELKKAIAAATGGHPSPGLLSRAFQGIRIALNEELHHLDLFLGNVLDFVNADGRVVIISYHSLEDRRVKQFFSRESRDCICPPGTPMCVCDHRARVELLTRRAIKPTQQETTANPRARSARLRAARRL